MTDTHDANAMRLVRRSSCLAIGSILAWLVTASYTEPAVAADSGAIVVRILHGQTPLENASVRLFQFDSDWRSLKDPRRELRSDASGSVRYERLATDAFYVLCAKTRDGHVGYKQCLLSEADARQQADLLVEQPVAARLHVTDDQNRPIAGASIWELTYTGANGSVDFTSGSLETCGLDSQPSNRAGELRLPQLPGGRLNLVLIHPDYAPCSLKGVPVDQKSVETATLLDGVNVTFQTLRDGSDQAIDAVKLDLRYEPFDHASSLIGRFSDLSPDGTMRLTVAQGPYSWLRLTHPEYVITPTYSEVRGESLADPSEPFQLQSGNDRFTFQLRRKVKVRGRVLEEASGKPLVGEAIQSELPSGMVEGPMKRFASAWSHADWGETDDQGRFEVQLAAGRARITFEGRGYVSTREHYELDVAPDGSTIAPDILVRPLPKVRGVVLSADGRPLPRAVVRFRGSMLTYGMQPVATDDQGRFELAPPWIPVNLRTQERQPSQWVVAFHPHKQLAAAAKVRFGRARGPGECRAASGEEGV